MSVLLSACSGQASESWPGITVGPDGQTVYVSYSSHVYQVNLANGSEIGRFPLEPKGKTTFYAPPAVTEDGNLLLGGYDFVFYSVKPGSEQANWIFDEAKDRYVGGALIEGDLVFAPSADGHLFALRRSTGEKVWEFLAEHALWGRPAFDGERLYVASMDHHVYALDPDTGEEIWKTEDLGGQIVTRPTISEDGRLFTTTQGSKTDDPSVSSQLVALDSATGSKLWNTPVAGWVWASPLLVDGVLYFGDSAGYFYAVDVEQGNLLWKYPASGEPKAKSSITGSPVAVEDKIFFGSEAGIITILNRSDGTSPQEIVVGGQIFSSLVDTGEAILFAPINYDEGILVAMNYDGTIKWKFLPAKK